MELIKVKLAGDTLSADLVSAFKVGPFRQTVRASGDSARLLICDARNTQVLSSPSHSSGMREFSMATSRLLRQARPFVYANENVNLDQSDLFSRCAGFARERAASDI